MNSTQAFRRHEIVHVFDDPGKADLTANVDFAYLKESLEGVGESGVDDLSRRTDDTAKALPPTSPCSPSTRTHDPTRLSHLPRSCTSIRQTVEIRSDKGTQVGYRQCGETVDHGGRNGRTVQGDGCYAWMEEG